MHKAEFDTFAQNYAAQHAASITLSGEAPDYFARYKIEASRKIADHAGLDVRHILDFGTGIGNSLAPLREFFPEACVTALDVSDTSLEQCRARWNDSVDFRCYDGEHIPADLGTFDLIFTACVFHHIDEDTHISLLEQIRPLLARGGRFILFEHNPWNPLTRHAVRTCPFDENAVLITAPEMRRRLLRAGFNNVRIDYRIFFPAFLSKLRPLEPALRFLPIGAQYSLTAS